MRVYLARHGETEWNAEHRLQGQSDPCLTPRGMAHARSLAALLGSARLDALFTSPLRRSVDTARPLASALGLLPETRPELEEIAYGALEGHTAADPDPQIRRLWKARKADPLHFRPPGGETYAELRARVAPFVDELLRRFPQGNVAIVGHRATNRVLLGLLLGLPLEASLDFKHKHDRVLEIRPGTHPVCIEHRYAPAAELRG